jgi:hypothetical protein
VDRLANLHLCRFVIARSCKLLDLTGNLGFIPFDRADLSVNVSVSLTELLLCIFDNLCVSESEGEREGERERERERERGGRKVRIDRECVATIDRTVPTKIWM